MTRGISASTLAAIEASSAEPIYFVELQFDSGTDRLHTHLGTITALGQSWTGAGSLASIEAVKETTEVSPAALRMGLSGIDSSITNLVFTEPYYMRPCKVYLGALSDGALIEDPSLIFHGFIQSIDMVFGGTGEGADSVVLTAESELILFQRSANVRYTDLQLQSEYSGDLGCEYMESVAIQSVVWRGKSNGLGNGPSRSGPAAGGSSGVSGSRPDR